MMMDAMRDLRAMVEATGEWSILDLRNAPAGRGHLALVIRHRRLGFERELRTPQDWEKINGVPPKPKRAMPLLEENGLSAVRNRLLRALHEGERSSYPLTIREAGEAIGIPSKGQVAYHYNWLVRNGYLTSVACRARSVRLTPKGRKAIAPLKGIIREVS